MSYQVVVPPWLDPSRNLFVVQHSFAALGIAPHGTKTRWVYRVPIGRMCHIQFLSVKISKASSSSDLGRMRAIFSLGKTVSDIDIWEPSVHSQTLAGVGSQRIQVFLPFELLPEEEIAAATQDQSSDGDVDWNVTMRGIEFDVLKAR